MRVRKYCDSNKPSYRNELEAIARRAEPPPLPSPVVPGAGGEEARLTGCLAGRIMLGMYRGSRKNKRFDFPSGRYIAGKYQIEEMLGSGWEGEVYRIVERSTGIRRAAKFYYPHRDPTGKAAIAYAASSTPCGTARFCCNITIRKRPMFTGGR